MPKVSVIIPVYGVEKYIERCARSLFEQTLDDIEYLFIDDCTPDKSIDILKSVLEEYPNRKELVIIHRMEMNSGQAAVRKWGMQNATGDYVIHCDSDDWVDLDLYEKMYSKAESHNLDVVCCDCKNTDCTNFTITYAGYKVDTKECIVDMMHRKMWWSLCNKIFKRELYDRHITYPKDAMGEDMCMCLQMMKNARSIGYVKETYYNYYTNPSSIVNVWTPEQCLNKYGQLTRNLDIVKECYKDATDKRIKKGLTYLTFYAQEMLMPAVKQNPEIKALWKKGLKGLCMPVVLNDNVALKQRVKAAMIGFNMFPR